MTDASTLAGEKVLGSLRREITLSRMVLAGRQGELKLAKYQPGARNSRFQRESLQAECGKAELLLTECTAGATEPRFTNKNILERMRGLLRWGTLHRERLTGLVA